MKRIYRNFILFFITICLLFLTHFSVSAIQKLADPGTVYCGNRYWPIVEGATWTFHVASGSPGTDNPKEYTEIWVVNSVSAVDVNHANFTIKRSHDSDITYDSYTCDESGIYINLSDGSKQIVLPPENELTIGESWGVDFTLLFFDGFIPINSNLGVTFNAASFRQEYGAGPGPKTYYAVGVGLVVETWSNEYNVGRKDLVSYSLPLPSPSATPSATPTKRPTPTITPSPTPIIDPGVYLFAPIIENGSVTLNGVAISKTSTISQIRWDWGDGVQENLWFPASHRYQNGGNYAIHVTANDLMGRQASYSISVNIPEQSSPLENCSPTLQLDPPIIVSGQAMINGKFTPDCNQVSRLHWDWGDGSQGDSGLPAQHTYITAGTYQVTTTVFDFLGRISTYTSNAVIDTPGQIIPLPPSQICAHPQITITSIDIQNGTLNLNGAVDSTCAAPMHVVFDWGDLTRSESVFPASHTYTIAGTWLVTVTAVDNLGQTSILSFPVTIDQPAIHVPPRVENTSKGSIQINAYSDINHNGIWDMGEAGISGLHVIVQQKNGKVWCDTFTAINGRVICEGLPLHTTYITSIEPPPGWLISSQAIPPVTLTDGTPIGLAYGIQPQKTSSIWGVVFVDTNRNNKFDLGDANLNPDLNVRMALMRSDGTGETRYTNVDPVNGSYHFLNLPTGIAFVILPDTLPQDYKLVSNNFPVVILGDTSARQDFALIGPATQTKVSANLLFPLASAYPNPAIAQQEVHFTASTSTSTGAQISEYRWDFGDGQEATGLEVDHIFSAQGNYQVDMTLVNTVGESKTAHLSLQVASAPLPIASTPVVKTGSILEQFYSSYYNQPLSDPDNIRSMQLLSNYFANQAISLQGQSQHYLNWGKAGQYILLADSMRGLITDPGDPDALRAIDYFCTIVSEVKVVDETVVGSTPDICSAINLGRTINDTNVVQYFFLNDQDVDLAPSSGAPWLYLLEEINSRMIMEPVKAESDFQLLYAGTLHDEACAAKALALLQQAAENKTITQNQARDLLGAMIRWESSYARQASLDRTYAQQHASKSDFGNVLYNFLTPLMFGQISLPSEKQADSFFTNQIPIQKANEELHNQRLEELTQIYQSLFGDSPYQFSCGAN